MGLETISYRVLQLWNLVRTEIKDAPSLSTLKENIKSWHCGNCQVGFAKHTLPV